MAHKAEVSMKFNKLARNKIPEYIREKDSEPKYHIAENEEYWEKLKSKVDERGGFINRVILEYVNKIDIWKNQTA